MLIVDAEEPWLCVVWGCGYNPSSNQREHAGLRLIPVAPRCKRRTLTLAECSFLVCVPGSSAKNDNRDSAKTAKKPATVHTLPPLETIHRPRGIDVTSSQHKKDFRFASFNSMQELPDQ